jgi:hypothetical protein
MTRAAVEQVAVAAKPYLGTLPHAPDDRVELLAYGS